MDKMQPMRTYISCYFEYCNRIDGQIHLVGLPLGGIIAINYALDFPEKVKTLVIIGTPHKIPKVAFEIQNVIFQFFPKSVFKEMAFDKKDTFALGNSIQEIRNYKMILQTGILYGLLTNIFLTCLIRES